MGKQVGANTNLRTLKTAYKIYILNDNSRTVVRLRAHPKGVWSRLDIGRRNEQRVRCCKAAGKHECSQRMRSFEKAKQARSYRSKQDIRGSYLYGN